jgi:DNA (cytosine-5)-methyltransferase 1
LRTVELFAGIGGFRIAADQNNLDTVWANDIDHTAVSVYKSNYGESSIIEGDIHDYLDDIPDHELLTAGFPCQPFSKAGKKMGIDDYRGTLFETIVTILQKKNPQYFLLENVNSLLFMNNGNHFRTILSALSSLDYKIEWRVFNAASFGLPQHRERVIILGSKDVRYCDSYFFETEDICSSSYICDIVARLPRWSAIDTSKGKFKNWGMAWNGSFVTADLPERQYKPTVKLRDILEENPSAIFDFTEDTKERIKNSQYVNRYFNGVQILYNQSGGARMGYSIFGIDGIAPTLTASTSRHYERYQVGNSFRRLTNIEYARIQGFPDNHCNATKPYNQYKLYGNAVPPQVISFAMDKIIHKKFKEIEKQTFDIFDFRRDSNASITK